MYPRSKFNPKLYGEQQPPPDMQEAPPLMQLNPIPMQQDVPMSDKFRHLGPALERLGAIKATEGGAGNAMAESVGPAMNRARTSPFDKLRGMLGRIL